MQDIPTLSLEDVLERYLGVPLYDGGQAIQTVECTRSRESRLRRWLPVKLVRRLDRGFARSDTVQPDTARSLYAIARALHPLLTVETGTYWGYSTAILAAAARDSGVGLVHSFDLYPRAGAHIPDSLRPWVHLHLGAPATESMPRVLSELAAPTLFFQDSVHGYEGVLAELQTALPFLAPDAVVVLHDFVLDGVRRAAVDALHGFFIAQIAGNDPQQLGIAIAPDRLVVKG
jgi:hypothetical protein